MSSSTRTREDDDWPTDRYDRYIPYDHDQASSRCPWCGRIVGPTDTVRTVGGMKGHDIEFTDPQNGGHPNVRTYHPRCWQKRDIIRRRIENEFLSAYL